MVSGSTTHLVLSIDGAARGNPGPAAIGIVLSDRNGTELVTYAEGIGIATNNEAEYHALLRGLAFAADRKAKSLEIRTDSELLAQQLNREFRVRATNLRMLYAEVQRALGTFTQVTVRHVPRWQNHRADSLANHALNERARRSN